MRLFGGGFQAGDGQVELAAPDVLPLPAQPFGPDREEQAPMPRDPWRQDSRPEQVAPWSAIHSAAAAALAARRSSPRLLASTISFC